MPLLPFDWVSLADIENLKAYTKTRLVERAIAKLGGKPSDYLIREVMFGDGTSDAALGNGWVDLSAETPQPDNSVCWAQAATDFGTANDYDFISATSGTYTEVPDGRFIAFFGAGDLSQQPGLLTGANTGTPPPLGNVLGIMFTTGGRTKDVWSTERLYGNGLDVSGFSFDVGNVGQLVPRPVFYDENDDIRIKMMSSEVSFPKYICLRGYCVEKWGNHISDTRYTKIEGGPAADLSCDPAAELTSHQKKAVITKTWKILYDLGAVKYGSTDDLISRDFIVADESHATERTHVDVDNRTAQTAGLESYGQSNSDITTLILSSVVAAGEEIDDGKWSGVWGFTDRTPNPDVHYMAFLYGTGNRIAVPHVEHSYLYHENTSCFFRTPLIWPENTPFDWQIAAVLATGDRFITLNGTTVEKKGKVIS